jgi:hypothetical protein
MNIFKKPHVHVDKSPSGTHPAVVGLRKKLDSIADNELAELEKMGEQLDADLEAVRTQPPPRHSGAPGATGVQK